MWIHVITTWFVVKGQVHMDMIWIQRTLKPIQQHIPMLGLSPVEVSTARQVLSVNTPLCPVEMTVLWGIVTTVLWLPSICSSIGKRPLNFGVWVCTISHIGSIVIVGISVVLVEETFGATGSSGVVPYHQDVFTDISRSKIVIVCGLPVLPRHRGMVIMT